VASAIEIPADSDFTLANLPFGVGRRAGWEPRAFVAIGDHAIDLHALTARVDSGVPADVFCRPDLNDFLALGPPAWRDVRACVADYAAGDPDPDVVVERRELEMLLPVSVGDYVDMYAGIHHATNLGRMFRPEGEPLLPNWRHIPVGYHGRSGTIAASGTEVVRPCGHVAGPRGVEWAASAQLDIELELAVVIGVPSRRGERVPIDDVDAYVFGLLLLNDWSARDIQAFEYQPLGPFLGKSFLTSVSPWLVSFDALAPALVEGLPATQDPEPAEHLRTARPSIPALHLEVALETAAMRAARQSPLTVSQVEVADALYWSPAQQIAHATSNGASLRTGDVFASGTLSGPDPRSEGGSFIELTARGAQPLDLPNGETRGFLEDGDRVVMRGWCGSGSTRVGFGELDGTVVAARADNGSARAPLTSPGG
jgi:fumarylacetoacetase